MFSKRPHFSNIITCCSFSKWAKVQHFTGMICFSQEEKKISLVIVLDLEISNQLQS